MSNRHSSLRGPTTRLDDHPVALYHDDADGDTRAEWYQREGTQPRMDYDAAIHERNGWVRYIKWLFILVVIACALSRVLPEALGLM